MHYLDRSALLMSCLWLIGCGREASDRQLFKLLTPEQTGIGFANTITANDSLNVQTDVYIYNGAGVAVGDVDNDGLPDIFFSGNVVSSRLYLNKGQMRFEDITERAGVTTKRWATGATMVDINNDGYLDVYVSVSGPEWSKAADRANLLFVNNGNRTFTESAAQYGIADTGFTTHAAFLDYDKDGCLDLFLLNNSPKDFTRGVMGHPMGIRGTTPGSYNELYRNNCRSGEAVRYTTASREAGILREAGYGLGVVVADLNGDNWPDIYVSNDGTPNDVLYVNDGDGTFTNKAAKWLKHASQAGMGVDIADFNNDGRPDILQVDMMPRDLERRKRTSGFVTSDGLLNSRSRGFRDDYSMNSLQLSNGVTKEGDVIFSEISRLAGVSDTDWSWSALFADFDNDGQKDIFISNGYPKAVNDLDYLAALNAARRRGDKARMRRLLADLPSYSVSNYVFRNNGDLTFTDKTRQWGLEQPGFSYGAAYADLNNDGRLDLVVNNIDAPASIYENVAASNDAHHWLEVRLVGTSPRQLTAGIGAQVILSAGGQKQYVYCTPYRGFMSTVDGRAHFGLGKTARVDSLDIEWPDGRHQVLTNVAADQMLTIIQSNSGKSVAAGEATALAGTGGTDKWFEPDLRALKYQDAPRPVVDYSVQPLLPYVISRQGPPIAVADVNADGLDDLFIGRGGGAGKSGALFIQRSDGGFDELKRGQPWETDTTFDDWGASFVDANGDGKPDLYVASGSYTLGPSSPLLQDRLYINQRDGRFARDVRALPPMLTSKSAVRVGDFNGDGRPDLFVGGRLTPRKYPYPTRSYILRNDGGRFADVTEEVAPELVSPGGMITDAAWVDFDGDGHLDLVTVGEWMAIRFFRNDGKKFHDVTEATKLPSMRGWWYSLAVGDFDHDGRPDLVAGNLGLNSSYTASKGTTFGIYANNFTGNQTVDLVLTEKVGGKEYPLAGMASLGRDLYPLTVMFPTYGSFAAAPLSQAFSSAQLQQALHYEVDTFASVYLHNDGRGKFTSHALPNLAQISPIRAMVVDDVDADGRLDLVVAGNLYDTEPNTAPVDAGNGLWLRGDGKGGFIPIPPARSGFLAPLNAAALALVNTAKGKRLLVANTGDSVQLFAIPAIAGERR